MITVLQIGILAMVAVAGTAVVLTKDTQSQVIGLSFYGLLMALMFFLFQAPDVALSQIGVGAVALPLMFMLAHAKVRRNREQRKRLKAEGRDEEEEEKSAA